MAHFWKIGKISNKFEEIYLQILIEFLQGNSLTLQHEEIAR